MLTTPFASSWNVTWIFGTPRGAGGMPGQLEPREAAVVGGHLALALEHVDGDEGLVVDARREDLALRRRDGRVPRDERREHAAARLDAERQRRHVEQEDLDLCRR